jgi:hypothetical protein
MVLVYLPTDIVYFHLAHYIVGSPPGVVAWLLWLGVFPAILLAAIAAHALIQRPAYAWLKAQRAFPPKGEGQ